MDAHTTWDGYLWLVLPCIGSTLVLDRNYGLLYQMDRSRCIGEYHYMEHIEVLQEKHIGKVWDPQSN